ncbi:GAF domain-containing protein [Kitasatospora acidiphila]|uniref:AfsR/SARP family transcriptional regulator n=1 Tax=Kitasatospora acidiphila TaxID=2567942 RepID=UPI003C729FAA
MAEPGGLKQLKERLEDQWSRCVPELRGSGRALPGDAMVRREVSDSWLRSLGTVDPAQTSAPVAGDGAVHPQWSESPLRAPVHDLADQLRCLADDMGYITAVTDQSGTILWTCGGRAMLRRAERVNFAPGGRWDEPAMGTNALSLALCTGRPSTVFSAEHLVAALHGWVCYCAPIRDPHGRLLGVLDLSSTWDRANPMAMATVRALVSGIEAGVRANSASQQPRPAPAEVRLSVLGRAELTVEGKQLRLPPRQLEILTLLALEPDGFTPERLRDALYADRPVAAATFRAEVSHLRRALPGTVATRTYALTAPLSCDALEVLQSVACGAVARAVRHYRGPLLPRSQAPGIAQWREHIEVAVREAVLVSPDPEHALRYGGRTPYDLTVHEHALRTLPPHDPRRALAAGRLAAAQHD